MLNIRWIRSRSGKPKIEAPKREHTGETGILIYGFEPRRTTAMKPTLSEREKQSREGTVSRVTPEAEREREREAGESHGRWRSGKGGRFYEWGTRNPSTNPVAFTRMPFYEGDFGVTCCPPPKDFPQKELQSLDFIIIIIIIMLICSRDWYLLCLCK